MLSQEQYPILKPSLALRHIENQRNGQEYFHILDMEAQRVENISDELYALLSFCDGHSSIEEILDNYTDESKPSLLEAFHTSHEVRRRINWNTAPNKINLLPGQIALRISQPILLKSVLFHVTNTCNFRCSHCYHNDYISPNDLTLAEIDDFFRQCAENGVETVTLSGGEPFIRKDLMDIVDLATKHYLFVQINTNGYFVNEGHLERLGKLRESRSGVLSISLDGPDEATHNSIRKHPQAWSSLMRLFPLMRDKSMKLRLSTIVSKAWLNDLGTIDKLIDYLNEFDVAAWVINFASHTGEALNNSFLSEQQLSYAEILELSQYILKTLQQKQPENIRGVSINEIFDWRPGQRDTVLPDNKQYKFVGEEAVLCDIHKDLLMVEPDGTVPFCSLYKARFPMEIGNLRAESVSALWNKLCQIRIQYSIPQRANCSSCEVLKYCGGGCPGHDPNPTSDLLTTCDRASKYMLPKIAHEYEKLAIINRSPIAIS